MKKELSLILFISFFIFTCTETFVQLDDGDKIDPDEGIVYFNLYYLEGVPVNSVVNLIFESFDRNYFYRVNVDKNSQRTVLLKIKAGNYYFSEVRTQADPDYATLEGKADVPSFEGEVRENYFKVEPGKINYLGDITLQIRRQNLGKEFSIRAINGPGREDMYLFDVHMTKSNEALKKKYPKLSSRYPIVNTKIRYDEISRAYKRAAIENASIGEYGKETFGKDARGYGNYKWGMNKDDIRLQLKAYKEKYVEKDDYLFINSKQETSRYFYFSKSNAPLWKKRLFMVRIIYKDASITAIRNAISETYGSPAQKNNKLVWELPYTIISLTRYKGKPLLEYLSKNHEKFKGN